MSKRGVTERRACLILGQHRSTQRKIPTRPCNETAALTADIVALAAHGRYGDRRIAAVGRLERKPEAGRTDLRREGLKVQMRPPKRGQLGFNDASCVRLQLEQALHVWFYDSVEDRTHAGRKFRMLNVIDESRASA